MATQQEETDGPIGGSDAPNYTYTGDGGVELSNPFRKLAYALKFREKNLLLSGQIDDDSKLQYIRTPRERVQKVAPFLELDEDPYPAVVDGRDRCGSSTATRPPPATRTASARRSARPSATARRAARSCPPRRSTTSATR